MKLVQDRMFRSEVARNRGDDSWRQFEREAFEFLRGLILREMESRPVTPVRRVLEDQIVWGRSPARLDLAGGWTDTPPYCLQHGGGVVNLAVNLNGQPPIQVFARLCGRPEIVIRSIDLGIEERVRTHAELANFSQVGSGFTVAKAALALCGFLPRFSQGTPPCTLKDHLEDFGGGIEISMLCAVPKGSGLGTSSILAATLLGTLGDLCGLNWSHYDLFSRTLALEQMLTTGGGWQDQIGGILRGVKFIETEPGLTQKPEVRWLPDHLFSAPYANKTILLYYTGLTRVAADILKEIVRGMFLHSRGHLEVLAELRHHAAETCNVIQRQDWHGLCCAIRTSWTLNQRIDGGTNPPAVQAILERVGDWAESFKLLGAGGGGYLLILAKDHEAARRIRETLTQTPPNPRARFVDFSLSETGLQITRS